MRHEIAIDDIVIGERHRKDMGDLEALADSMSRLGLLQPVVVSSDNSLVAGERRIRAARMLGWERIPVRVVDLENLIEGEFAENVDRKEFAVSERVAIGIAIEAQIGDRRRSQKVDPQRIAYAGVETRAVAAEKAGFGNPETYRQAKSVVADGEPDLVRAVDDGDVAVSAAAQIAALPKEQQTEILKSLARDGDGHLTPEAQTHIRTLAKEIRIDDQRKKAERRQRREQELGARIAALPDKRYGVIVSDPEWSFEPFSRETGMDRAADNHYPTSDTAVIADRPVASIAADDCILFLWATVPMLKDALRVLEAWGFTYKTQFVWVKDRIGTGYWNRNQHEILLVGTKGDVPAPAMGTQKSSVILAPVGAHSAKPEVVLDMIEAYFPSLPKIELNRRGPARLGWDAWGNEAVTDIIAKKPLRVVQEEDNAGEAAASHDEQMPVAEPMPDAGDGATIDYTSVEDAAFTVEPAKSSLPPFMRRGGAA